ncbi:rubrerythrin [Acetanaerobacterium elongatum]|uniref:Rubrerythrin n=1 Tax=Acetanaerobacterium elongatum TaxID=258515 RepID=A0A1G9X115_9FIRM|nr:rubrerythrin family protein [Acetanaerobacterium elongatum]SDM90474.1 Rubrerythrin [Acetanaerobacterium elongatum]
MELQGSKTEKNLLAAFAGEAQAWAKYSYYESQAKADGLNMISEVFKKTADNEAAHAKIWFRQLHDNSVPPTVNNLIDAIAGEHYEWSEMYAQFAQTARDEGFTRIAALFEGVLAIERAHEERYQKNLNDVNNNKVYSKDGEIAWICSNCGHVHYGKEAPAVCPVCEHPKAYFQPKTENN